MKLLLLTLMYQQSEYENYKKRMFNNLDLPVAANVFQSNLIKGLYENGISEMEGVNSLPVGTWPSQYGELFLASKENIVNGLKCHSTSTINIVGIKQITRTISSYKIIKKIVKENPDINILSYNFYLPYYVALTLLKIKGYQFKLCTLVTDLPNEFGIVTEKGIRKLIANIIGKITMRMTQIADGFVLLTEHMKYPLNVGDRKYTVVEGFASSIETKSYSEKEVRNIVYTGTLSVKFGIAELVSEFQKLENKNIELHLYGSGDATEYVKSEALKDKRIKYYGSVDRDIAIQAQRTATFLINPRDDKDSYTKYSFPSKTMEYLASGRPVLAYLLPGIPEEYESYILPIRDKISSTLKNVIELDEAELRVIGDRGKNFINQKKNKTIQTAKIINLLKEM